MTRSSCQQWLRYRFVFALWILVLGIAVAGCCRESVAPPATLQIRVATYNIEDVRSEELADGDNPRLKAAAARIQAIRPDIILLNEIAYSGGADGQTGGEIGAGNGQKFADLYLSVSQGEGLEPIAYQAFSAPVNTGVSSGFDLDNNGEVVTDVPPMTREQTDEGRAYAGDCWGFGTFPGQYGMALLVRKGLTIQLDQVRTFRDFKWRQMPLPARPGTRVNGKFFKDWDTDEEWNELRLSSKSHWDVPVELPNG